MGAKPVIGITPGYRSEGNRIYIGKGYTDAIISAGGIPMLLPLTLEEDVVLSAMGKCDGILLSGGPDVDGRFFGEDNLNCGGEISPYRDYVDILAAKTAVEGDKPVLGICRGAQVLNIALGGSIYQDIFSQIKGKDMLKHRQEAPEWYPVHEVSLKEGSRIFNAFAVRCIGVNSFHHQAVKETGTELEATAWSPDGVIEAVEHTRHRFAVGVQWHPELMWRENTEQLALFAMLVRAAGGSSDG